MKLHTWTNEYYDILEFFFWEPQHLGKIKNVNNPKSLDEVLTHLGEMEVTLNHQFNLFFQLLPSSLFQLFFKKINPSIEPDIYKFLSEKEIGIKDATQPDLFFDGKKSAIAIEMKINAMCNLEQVMKYALLFYFNNKKAQYHKNNHLILIGKKNIENLFKEKFTTTKSLKYNLNENLIPDITKKGKITLTHLKKDILNTSKTMSITFINYQQFFDVLKWLKRKIDTNSAYNDTVFKLINGIQEELTIRKLAKKDN